MASIALASAARRRAWRRPEWPWVALVVAAWAVLVAGAATGGDGAMAGHPHAPSLPSWTLMVVAMMLPATIGVLRAVSFDSMWDRRYRSPALFGLAYLAVWIAFGAVALGA